jgi:hypothetical protein
MPVAAVTVSEMVVVAVSVPEVPVIVIVDVPVAAVLAAVSVRVPLEVDGLEVQAAVTPAGSPEAARVTEPLNGLTSVMLMVSGLLEPAASESVAAEGVSKKLPAVGAAVTVSAMVVDAVSEPEVPLMVIVLVPVAAVLATVNISPLVPVVGLASSAAVTPVGRPETARVTEPVNPLTLNTLMVSLALSSCGIDIVVAVAQSVKLGFVVDTVTAIEVVSMVLPEVPVTAMVAVPVAVLLAAIVSVSPLTVTVTPVFELVAVRVTGPVKPPVSVTVMASVTLAPGAIVSVVDAGVSVKPPTVLTVIETALDVLVA